MEEYVDYLKGKIQECELEDMHVSVSVYKEVLNTYLSFLMPPESIVTYNKSRHSYSRLKKLVSCQILQSFMV
jgi:hypothetical protein